MVSGSSRVSTVASEYSVVYTFTKITCGRSALDLPLVIEISDHVLSK